MKARLEKLRNDIALSTQKNSFLFIAFIIPCLIMLMIYIALEVFPFGNNSVLVLDLNGQYVYFFEDLKHKLLEGSSMLYTWTRSLGGEFMGIFAYYLSSPFSFLVALFPDNNMTEALLLIILLKTGCMGVTMAYYLNESHPTKKFNTVIFSTCYALSAFAVVMANNTMWMDCLILLPLVTLGIERLVKKGAFKLFVFSVAMSLLTSFYIGYMVCIYVAFYFFYYYLASSSNNGNNYYLEDNHFFKSFLRIVVYSAIAIAIASIIILPAYTSLQFGKNEFSDPVYTFNQRFDWLDLVVKLFPGSYDTVRPEGIPFVYCGTIVLLLMPMYFLTSRINHRERLMGGALIIFYLISFNIDALDIIWHGFQKPNWLNYRYSFIFSFILIVFAYKAFGKLKYANYKNVALIGGILAVLVFLIQKQNYEHVDDLKTVGFSLLCITIFCVALYFVYSKKHRATAVPIVALLVFAELFTSGLMNAVALDEDVIMSSRDSYNDYMNAVRPAVEFVKDYDTGPFYRMEKNFHRQDDGRTNDSMALNFYGISNSTSTLNKESIEILHRFGYASESHWSQYLGGTPVSDALLGIKYVISKYEINNLIYNELKQIPVDPSLWSSITLDYVSDENNLFVYENPLALSLAYASSKDVLDFRLTDNESPFLVMNSLVSAITGSPNLELFTVNKLYDTTFVNIDMNFATNHRKYSCSNEGNIAQIEYTVPVESGKPLYMYIPTDYPRECSLYVNGESVGDYMGNKTDCVKYLGVFDYDGTVTVTLRLKDEPIYIRVKEEFFFTLDTELFKNVFTELSKGNLNITSFDTDRFEGNISVGEGQELLYTSVVFDEGWIVKVDGKEMPLIKTTDGFIAVEISEGKHHITFTYRPKCYVLGSALSIIGLISFSGAIAAEYVIKKRKRDKILRELNAVSEEI